MTFTRSEFKPETVGANPVGDRYMACAGEVNSNKNVKYSSEPLSNEAMIISKPKLTQTNYITIMQRGIVINLECYIF